MIQSPCTISLPDMVETASSCVVRRKERQMGTREHVVLCLMLTCPVHLVRLVTAFLGLHWASLIAQLVKYLPAVRETLV